MNTTKCPTCRRRFTIGDNQCSRCGTDLSLLSNLEQEFLEKIKTATERLTNGKPKDAEIALNRALQIHSDSIEARKLMSLCKAASGNFRSALRDYFILDKRT